MARNDGIDRTLARNRDLSANDIKNAQAHNEREKEMYSNPDIVPAETHRQARSNIGAGTYSKPSDGIPSSDMASAVQTSLGKADTAYQKPGSGIPGTDLASGVIPTVPSAYTSNPAMDGTASAGSSASFARGDHVHPTDTSRQSTAITDAGGYYTTDTVEGALQEIGAELSGINTLIGTGVIV